MNGEGKNTFLVAARRVLTEAGEPLHYREITRRALAAHLVDTQGQTPEATLYAQISVNIKRKGPRSEFVRTAPGIVGLGRWGLPAISEGPNGETGPGDEGQSYIPHYPTYSEVRALLPVWEGCDRRSITRMKNEIWDLRGSPQENVDWTDPDSWIVERLQDPARSLALATWQKSGRKVNPRHVTGHWRLITRYRLLDDPDGGPFRLTPRGQEFLTEPAGLVVREIDLSQGLVKVLELLAEIGTSVRSDLIGPWSEYIASESRLRSEMVLKAFLWERLRNLVDREFVERAGNSYSLTPAGLSYLRVVGVTVPSGEPQILQQVRQLAVEQRRSAREDLAKFLADMEPYAFEHVIRRLLEELGYESVEVTQRSNDRGVDVVANIVVGITSIRELVQVKRHRGNIHRPVLDALRGSLHRFKGVRGTIITTGGFSKGTLDAAFELGAAPITLIDGERLLDLLIENGIGMKKEKVDLWRLDPDALLGPTTDDPEGEE